MRQIRTALLSYGTSGQIFHAPFLELHPGYELIGSWERNKTTIANDYPHARTYPTLESVLDDAEVELVIVNTPTVTHFEYAKAALLAGKHVIVEKAFTTTAAEAKLLHDIATSEGLKLAVYQNRRWDSDFRTVRSVLEKNLLGEIVEAEIHFDRYNPQLSPKTHKETRNPGAGIIKDLGAHIIDQALVLFGFPQALYADIRTTRTNSVVDDWFDITLFYDSSRVRLKGSYLVREALPSYIFHGKIGSFIKSRGDIQEAELKQGKKPMLSDWGKEPDIRQGVLHTEIEGEIVHEHIPTLPGNYYYFFDLMYQAIVHNATEPVTAFEGYQTMRIIDAAFRSTERGEKVVF